MDDRGRVGEAAIGVSGSPSWLDDSMASFRFDSSSSFSITHASV
jgi:hypothetical protein